MSGQLHPCQIEKLRSESDYWSLHIAEGVGSHLASSIEKTSMSKSSNLAAYHPRNFAAWSNATLITVVILIRCMFDLMKRSEHTSSRLIWTAEDSDSIVDDESPSSQRVEIRSNSVVPRYVNGDLKTPYDIVIEKSTNALLRIVSASDNDLTEKSNYAKRPWLLVPTESAIPLWTSSCNIDGIILRTTAYVGNTAQHILTFLMSKDITSGLEGITESGSTQVVESYHGGSVIVKRICFKGSLRAAKREFIVITSISHLPDGSYIMCSRSLYAPESMPRYLRRSRNGHVKGVIYATGFHIRPTESSGGNSCEVRFGCHLNMLGPVSSEGAANKSKLEDLLVSLRSLMEEICSCPVIDGEYLRSNRTAVRTINVKSEHAGGQVEDIEEEERVPLLLGLDLSAQRGLFELSPGQITSILCESSSASNRIKQCHHSLMATIDLPQGQSLSEGNTSAGSGMREREKEKEKEMRREPEITCWTAGVWNTAPTPAPVPVPVPISPRWRSISDKTLSFREQDTKATAKIDAWDVLTSQHGVTTYEALSTSMPTSISTSTTVYAAQCHVQLNPSEVRILMTHSPHLFDPSLCRRSDLGCLDSGTTLQWLARTPSRWSLGPGSGICCSPSHTEREIKRGVDRERKVEREMEIVDYIVVTTEQTLGCAEGGGEEEGFWTCSSSVDRVVEETDLMDTHNSTDTSTDNDIHAGIGSSSRPCTRAHMSMEGFMAIGDGYGGTTLTLLLETGGGAYEGRGIPDWLIRHALERDVLDRMGGIRAACTCIIRDSYTRSMDSSYQAAFSTSTRALSPLINPDSSDWTGGAVECESDSRHRESPSRPVSLIPKIRPRPVSVPTPVSAPVSASMARPVSRPMSVARKGVRPPPIRDDSTGEDSSKRVEYPLNSFTPYSPTSVRSITSVISADKMNSEKSSDGGQTAAPFDPTDGFHTQTNIQTHTQTKTRTTRPASTGTSRRRSVRKGETISDSPVSIGDSAMRVDTSREGLPAGGESGVQSVKSAHTDSHSEWSVEGMESPRSKVPDASHWSPPCALTTSPLGCSARTTEDMRSSPRRRRDEGSIERELSEIYVPEPKDGDGPITPLFLDEGVRLIQRYFGVLDEGTGMRSTATHTGSLLRPKSQSKLRPEEQSDLGLEWQNKGQWRGVSVSSSMVRGSTWQAIKAVCGMHADKWRILDLLMDNTRLGDYDEMFSHGQLLHTVDDRTAVRRLCYKPVWPTSSRDFLTCTTWRERADGSLVICTRSAPNELMGPQKGSVRGTIIVSGYLIQPAESLRRDDPCFGTGPGPKGCKVTMVAHTELGGSLPAPVINMLSTTAPQKMMRTIADLIAAF